MLRVVRVEHGLELVHELLFKDLPLAPDGEAPASEVTKFVVQFKVSHDYETP